MDAIHYDASTRQLMCRGDWDLAHLPELQAKLSMLSLPRSGDISLNGEHLGKLDSAGAWFLI